MAGSPCPSQPPGQESCGKRLPLRGQGHRAECRLPRLGWAKASPRPRHDKRSGCQARLPCQQGWARLHQRAGRRKAPFGPSLGTASTFEPRPRLSCSLLANPTEQGKGPSSPCRFPGQGALQPRFQCVPSSCCLPLLREPGLQYHVIQSWEALVPAGCART